MSKKLIIAIVVVIIVAIVGKFVMQDNNLLYYSTILAIVAALFIAYVKMRDKTKTRETREKDRKIRENKEKYKHVSGVLRTFVRKFNDPYLLDILTKGETRISRLISRRKKLVDLIPQRHLFYMSENSEKCEKLGENFEPDEKKFFDDVLTKIDNFIKKYTSLLSELKEISNRNDEYVDKEIYKIFDKIGELYPETYQNIVDDVSKKLEEFNQHLEGMNS